MGLDFLSPFQMGINLVDLLMGQVISLGHLVTQENIEMDRIKKMNKKTHLMIAAIASLCFMTGNAIVPASQATDNSCSPGIPYDISTTQKYSVFTKQPVGFVATLEAAGCFLRHEDKILLLKRNANKPEGNTWGIPGGKIKKKETPIAAVKRETFEETGVDTDINNFKYIGTNYLILPGKNVIFHMYCMDLSTLPDIRISRDEHQDFKWVTAEEALTYPLMPGEIESFIRYAHAQKQKNLVNPEDS
jgi:8-oxo-dGTP diphosphatase